MSGFESVAQWMRMKLILLHNPHAGTEDSARKEMIAALEAKGFEVIYQSTREEDYEEVLLQPVDMVAIAGGDGTLGKVFRKLAGMPDVPVLVLPAGTANNIAKSLALGDDWTEVMDRFERLMPTPFFFGSAAGETEELFFESVGVGLFAEMLDVSENDGKRMKRLGGGREGFEASYATLGKLAAETAAIPVLVTSRRFEFSHRVLWLEVMNIRSIGPSIDFGGQPEVDGSAGFPLMVIPEGQRQDLVSYFQSKAEGSDAVFPEVAWYQIDSGARILWPDGLHHLDDEPREWSVAADEGACLEIQRVERPLRILR